MNSGCRWILRFCERTLLAWWNAATQLQAPRLPDTRAGQRCGALVAPSALGLESQSAAAIAGLPAKAGVRLWCRCLPRAYRTEGAAAVFLALRDSGHLHHTTTSRPGHGLRKLLRRQSALPAVSQTADCPAAAVTTLSTRPTMRPPHLPSGRGASSVAATGEHSGRLVAHSRRNSENGDSVPRCRREMVCVDVGRGACCSIPAVRGTDRH